MLTKDQLTELENRLTQNETWIALHSDAKAEALKKLHVEIAEDICYEEEKKLKDESKPKKTRASRKRKSDDE